MNINEHRVINNKYFVSDDEFMEIVKNAEYGYILKNINDEYFYAHGRTEQGFVFKDYENYAKNNGICYICEGQFEVDGEMKSYIKMEGVKRFTKDDFDKAVKNELYNSYAHFFSEKQIPVKLIDRISKYAFNQVDWQTPDGLIYEYEWDNEICDYFIENQQDLCYASNWLKSQIEDEIIDSKCDKNKGTDEGYFIG